MDSTFLSDFYSALLALLLLSKRSILDAGTRYDLSAQQLFTLLCIDPGTPKPMNSLSITLACDASNVTGIVDGLEEKKLLERHESPKDRRVKMLHMTPKGEAVRKQVIKNLAAQHDASFFKVLSDDEMRTITAILQRVAANTSKQVAQR